MADRKNLLSEATVRRFMKLAELAPLAEPFVENMPAYARDEEEEPTPEEAEYDAAYEDEGFEAGEEAADDEVALDVDADAEVESGPMTPEDMIAAMAEKLQDLAAEVGVEVDVETDDEEVEDVGAMDDLGAEEFDAGEEELELDVEDELDEDNGPEAQGDDAYVNEDKAYTAKKEKPGADKRKGAKKRGAEGTKKKTSGKGRGEKKGDDAYVNEEHDHIAEADIDLVDDDALVQEISRRVINRLLKK